MKVELLAAELAGFAFENFEEERELGDLDGLRIDVHAVEVGDEDAFALGGGELPVAGGRGGGWRGRRKRLGDKPLHLGRKRAIAGIGVGFVERGIFLFGPSVGVVGHVVGEVPVEEIFEGAEEEGAGAAGGVEDGEVLDRFGRLAGEEGADRLLDDVADDVGGRVVDAAGFADFGLFLDDGPVVGGEMDNLAEELFVNVAEDLGGGDGEGVGTFWPVEGGDDLLQNGVVESEAEGEPVGRLVAAFFAGEVEEAGVVAEIGALKDFAEAGVDLGAGGEGEQLTVGPDAAVFGDAEEDDAVEDALDGEVEFALGEGVAEGEVAGEEVAPVLHVGEEFVVELGGAAFALGGGGVFVEGAAKDGVLGKDGGDLVPLLRVLVGGAVKDAAGGGLVVFAGSLAGVVDGELVKIGDDAEGKFGGKRVAAELGGGGGIVLDFDEGLLGLDEEFAGAADAEGVVGGGGGDAGDFQGLLVDDVFVGLGVAGGVVDIPAERGEEGVEKFAAQLGFLVVGVEVGIEVAAEGIDEGEEARGDRHGVMRCEGRARGRASAEREAVKGRGRAGEPAGRISVSGKSRRPARFLQGLGLSTPVEHGRTRGTQCKKLRCARNDGDG